MQTKRRLLSPVALEVYRALLTAAAEEMGATLRRTAHSPNIKERRDYSCGLFDLRGAPVALGDHMPVHLGAMPRSVKAVLRALRLRPGDVAVLNDPFEGGTHLPDLTAVRAVPGPRGGAALAYAAARAHHADVGGMSPGSMPLAQEIYQEGLRLPPVLLVRGGRIDAALWRVILANVRTPDEREGDLRAQLAALETGVRRITALARRRGASELRRALAELVAYGDRLVRAVIREIPDGRYEAEDVLDDDGLSPEPVPIRVALEVRGARMSVDFTGSAPQCRGGVNAVAAITESAVRYVLRCVAESMLDTPLPAGGGALSAVTLVLPEGSVVAARPPAAVAAGNVETSQRIVDVLLRALGDALPDLIPACSSGTMNNLTLGGLDPRRGAPFAYYETVAGGMGAGPASPGLSGTHTHMTNSWNTPIEALEHAIPIRVRGYSIRAGSGGAGRHRGGDGLRRDLEVLVPARVTLLSERRAFAPCGARGGAPGAKGENALGRDGRWHPLPGKGSWDLAPGEVLSVRTPGGGGWGPPPS